MDRSCCFGPTLCVHRARLDDSQILILSVVAIARTPTDIFPSIDIPVIAVDWTYTGLNPEELEGRLTSAYEYPGTGSPEAPSASATPLPTGIRDRQPPSLEV